MKDYLRYLSRITSLNFNMYTYTALRDGIFTHPTLAEGLNALFLMLDS